MLDISARLKFDVRKMSKKMDSAISRTQVLFDSKVIADMSPFVPYDTGTLQRSVNRSIGTGMLKYDMVYARRLYYNPQFNFNKTKHPQAGGKWFAKAKAIKKNEWLNFVDGKLHKEFKNA